MPVARVYSFLAPVEMMLRNVLDDPVGHEVPHRVSSLHSVAAVRRRDGEGGDLELTDVVTGQAVRVQHVSRARHSDEVGEIPQLIMVSPTENLRYGVRARDEEQLRVWALGLQIAERVDGVGGS